MRNGTVFTTYIKGIVIFLLVCSFNCRSVCQDRSQLNITFIDEDSLSFSASFKDLIVTEINSLLSLRAEITYKSLYSNNSMAQIRRNIDMAMSDNTSDLIIGMGLMSSMILAQNQIFTKPSISSIIIDRNIQNLQMTADGGSGINNFTYVETPFDVEKDVKRLHEMTNFEKLGILFDGEIDASIFLLDSFIYSRLPEGTRGEFIRMSSDPLETVNNIPKDIDALYILTISQFDLNQTKYFFNLLNKKGIPSFALLGRTHVELGAMAGLAPEGFLPNLARRIALDVLSISEGENAANLSVQIQKQDEDFVINMESARTLNLYPDFDLLNQAILLNVENTPSEVNWNIENLIFEALRANLNLMVSKKNIDLAHEDVNIAKSSLYPQLDIGSSGVWIDDTRVDNSNGQAASVSWVANASLSQLIYSEPALANVAIQKIVKETENVAHHQDQLDLILEASQAFLTFLQTKSFVRIRNKNVDVTNQNLNISRSKERLGYSGISDVYRLESELADNVIELNDALSNMRQARININRIINHPQSDEFTTTDITRDKMFSLAGESQLNGLITNRVILNSLTDFLVVEAFKNLPELKQIDLTLDAQERLLQSNERKFYLPDVGLSATWDQAIRYFGQSVPPLGFKGLSRKPELTIGASLSLPITTGGERKAEVQKSKLSIEQLKDQEHDLRNNLEAAIRSNMEVLAASFQRVFLSDQSKVAANKNFEIIQDLYRQGEVDIVTLIDAQNAALFADLSSTNSIYQYIFDFLATERSTGIFYFMLTDAEKEAYFIRLNEFILRKE